MEYGTIYVKANKKDYFFYDYVADELGRYKRILGATVEQLEENIEKERLLREKEKDVFSGEENIKDVANYWIDYVASKSPTSFNGLGLILTKKYKNIVRNVVGNERITFGTLSIKDVTTKVANSFLKEIEGIYEQDRAVDIYNFLVDFFAYTNKAELTKIGKIKEPISTVDTSIQVKATLSKDEMEQLYEECFSKRKGGEYQYTSLAIIVAIMVRTGCPYGKIAKAKISDIDFSTGIATFEDRKYVLDARIISVLKGIVEGRDADDFVFKTKRGTVISANSVEQIFKKLGEYLYIPYIRMRTVQYNYGRLKILDGESFNQIYYNMGYETTIGFIRAYEDVIAQLDKEDATRKIANIENAVVTKPDAMNYVLSLSDDDKNKLLADMLIKYDDRFNK